MVSAFRSATIATLKLHGTTIVTTKPAMRSGELLTLGATRLQTTKVSRKDAVQSIQSFKKDALFSPPLKNRPRMTADSAMGSLWVSASALLRW